MIRIIYRNFDRIQKMTLFHEFLAQGLQFMYY